jgi:hypothetical protein
MDKDWRQWQLEGQYTRMLIMEQDLGHSKQTGYHRLKLHFGLLSHQVLMDKNWRPRYETVEYGQMLIMEQELGLKHPHHQLWLGIISHQVPTEQNWWQWQGKELVDYGRTLVLEQDLGLSE